MYRTIVAVVCIWTSGCTSLSYPVIPGRADNVKCTLERSDGAIEGKYACSIDGRYEIKEIGF